MNLNLNKPYPIISAVTTAFLILITGCEEITDFPGMSESEVRPVVEAVLTSKPEVQQVRVSYSTSLNDSLSSTAFEDAVVKIYTDQGDTVIYEYAGDGLYKSKPFCALEGKKYTLEVIMGNLVTRSISEIVPVKNIDSLYYKIYQKTKKDTLFHVFINAGQVDPAQVKYYLVQLYKNDTLVTTGNQIWSFHDKYMMNLNDIELPENLRRGDTVDLELQTITKSMYDYYYLFSHNIFSEGLTDQNYRTNPPEMFDKNVLGYFQVSAVSRKRIVIGSRE